MQFLMDAAGNLYSIIISLKSVHVAVNNLILVEGQLRKEDDRVKPTELQLPINGPPSKRNINFCVIS